MASFFDRVMAATVAARDAFAGARAIGPQFPNDADRSTPNTVAADAPYISRTPFMQGASMSPGSVSSVMRQCELGYMSRWCDLLSEFREKTPHMHSVLQTRELAIAGCPWQLKPRAFPDNRKRDVKMALKVRDYVHERIEAIPQFRNSIKHLAAANYFGRSALEIEWVRDARGVGVRALHPIQPKRLSYASSWRLHLWDELGNEYDPRLGQFPGVDIDAEWPDKFIIHAPQTIAGEIPTRQGLGRILAFICLFSIWNQRDWMMFVERFAQPWRVGTYKKGADDEDIAILKQVIAQMSGATGAAIPDTTSIELHQPSGQNRAHLDMRYQLNSEISKVVLGQTMTTESPVGGGSRALGEVQERVKQDVLDEDAANESESFTFGLCERMVRLTFGAEVAAKYTPAFELISAKPEDLQSSFTRVIALATAGVPFDGDEARKVYTPLSKPDDVDAPNIFGKRSLPANDGGKHGEKPATKAPVDDDEPTSDVRGDEKKAA